MDRQALVSRLDALLVQLNAPVSVGEAKHGWTHESKSGMGKFFEQMRGDAIRGVDLTR